MSKYRIVLILDDSIPAQSTLLGQIQTALASIAGNLLTASDRATLAAMGAAQNTLEVDKIA